jgi:hypothetical protein
VDAVEGLELLAQVAVQGGAVADVGPMLVFQAAELLEKRFFELAFGRRHAAWAASLPNSSTGAEYGGEQCGGTDGSAPAELAGQV